VSKFRRIGIRILYQHTGTYSDGPFPVDQYNLTIETESWEDIDLDSVNRLVDKVVGVPYSVLSVDDKNRSVIFDGTVAEFSEAA
jgi:hypothetical protein